MTSFSHEVSPMKKAIVAIAVVFISVTCCVWVFGVVTMGHHPPGVPVAGSPDWPEGTKELVNREGRISGYWSDGFGARTDSLFFAGDTDAFNEFVAQYAMLKDTPLTLVLHPGRGLPRSPWDKEIPFEWKVHILHLDPYPAAPEAATPVGELDIRSLIVPEEARTDVVTVNLYLGGQVELDKVKVPLNVEVKSGGEIEQFIAAHQARQQAQNLSD